MSPLAHIARTAVAAAALTALGLAAATPAAAHTNNMYTFIDLDRTGDPGFATIGKTDAVTVPLAESFIVQSEILGIEVANEKGTAILHSDGAFVVEWNHTTGAVGTPTSVYFANTALAFQDFTGLDTLNDGTTVTLVNYNTVDLPDDEPVLIPHWVIAGVNSTTGELTPLVQFGDAISNGDVFVYIVDSLATDPATGVTYVFLHDESLNSYFLPVDVAAKTVGTPTQFDGDGWGEHYIQGADFDTDGSLYFYTYDFEAAFYPLELNKLGAPSTWPTASLPTISIAPAQFETIYLAPLALTIEHTALAATGSELPIAAIVLVGSVAVLAGGVTVMVARRRSERGTV